MEHDSYNKHKISEGDQRFRGDFLLFRTEIAARVNSSNSHQQRRLFDVLKCHK